MKEGEGTISYATPQRNSRAVLWVILAVVGGVVLLTAFMLVVLGLFWVTRPAVAVRSVPAVPAVPVRPAISGAPAESPASPATAATGPAAQR